MKFSGGRPASLVPPLLLLLLLPADALGILKHIWHISDVHVDDNYTATADPSAWCHPDTAGAGPEHWFGQKGCGLPWHTASSAVDFMAATLSRPDVIVWTGDTAPHWPYTDWSYVFPKLRRVSAMLRAAFPQAVIVPTIGNHDAFPSDQFPADNGSFYAHYLQQSGWADLLPEEARATFRRGGYYSVTAGDYRLIALNTALYYNKNRDLRDAGDDPAGQLAWLEEQLNMTDLYAIVTAHISPGFPHWSTNQTNLYARYNSLLQRALNRPGTLERRTANLFGHEHIDTFQNVYRTDLKFEQHTHALNTYLMAPSLVPGTLTQRLNPAVRLYTLLSGKINDYIQFHLDLAAANEAHRRNGSASAESFWKVTYRMREAYGLPDVGTTSMHLLFKDMKSTPAVFDKYWRYTDGEYGVPPGCDATCRRERLCVISSQQHQQMSDCLSAAGCSAASLAMVGLAALSARLLPQLLR